jgi:hypothetical protein
MMNAFVSAALRGAFPTIFTALVVAATFAPSSAWAGDPAPASTETKAAAAAATVTPATATPATSGDKWRFVWHNNQWWYYQPDGQWLIHDGSAWHAPQAVVPTAQVYRSAPAYGYSNQAQPRYRQFMGSGRNGGGMSNDGFWGNSARYWTYQHVLRGQ